MHVGVLAGRGSTQATTKHPQPPDERRGLASHAAAPQGRGKCHFIWKNGCPNVQNSKQDAGCKSFDLVRVRLTEWPAAWVSWGCGEFLGLGRFSVGFPRAVGSPCPSQPEAVEVTRLLGLLGSEDVSEQFS